MLARRFTIVCLIVALFGMGLSMLVAENGRASQLRAQGVSSQFCDAANAVRCLTQLR